MAAPPQLPQPGSRWQGWHLGSCILCQSVHFPWGLPPAACLRGLFQLAPHKQGNMWFCRGGPRTWGLGLLVLFWHGVAWARYLSVAAPGNSSPYWGRRPRQTEGQVKTECGQADGVLGWPESKL